ncbi:MAG: ATP-binding protein [Bacteroidales bacterium]
MKATRKLITLCQSAPVRPGVLIGADPAGLSSTDYYDMSAEGVSGIFDPSFPDQVIPHLMRSVMEPGGNVQGIDAELLKYIIDSHESMISVINSDLKYEAVNESFCRTLNCNREEIIGICPSKLWGDQTFREKIEENLHKCLKGEVVRYKAYFNKSGVSGKCYEVIYRPFKPVSGDRSYSIVETRDVTEFEDIKRLAEKSDIRNHYLEKYLPFGVFDCDRKGRILFANDTFNDILETGKEEVAELNIFDFLPFDTRFADYLNEINMGESSTFSQLRMKTGSGAEIFARISSHARYDDENGLIINSILEDTTREVLMERKLTSTHRMETLGTLAGGIAHDFNTILTTISGYSELTMDEVEPDSDIYGYMYKVSHAIKRAESVINQMLTFSRQIELEKIPVEVSEVVREVTDFMRSAIPYNIYLESEIEENEMVVLADPTQLFRVFLNIMTNSVQAMEPDGGTLKIKVYRSELADKQFADIAIVDTGSGIDKSVIERIYEPFFTTKEIGKGTGMGLSVAHGIVSGLGGELNVESTPGSGTTFTVRLPLMGPGMAGEMGKAVEPTHTIIYADENIFFSRTVSLALERLGYRVILASGQDDFSLLAEQNRSDIDIIFIRCGLTNNSADLVTRVINNQVNSRVVLIVKPGSDNFRTVLQNNRERISIINEPVSLREILNAIHSNC